jgi:hypothetical protein
MSEEDPADREFSRMMRAQEEDLPQQQSFMTMLYANDSFLKMKETLTEEML